VDHVSVLKRAFLVTWRCRALWLFGFFLALCSGGSGGGSGNYSPPSSSGDFDMPMSGMPDIDWQIIIAIIVALLCFVLLVALLGIVVRAVTRTALIGMVAQVSKTESVTIKDGWRLGWSKRAWRLFWIGVIIGIPVAIISVTLVLLAFSPLLLLLFSQEAAVIVVAVILTIFTFLFVLLILVAIGAIVAPLTELSWRHTVLDERGIMDSLGITFSFIKHHLKDVVIVWLLLLGVGLLWVMLVFVVVLPISLLAALIVGGIPALIVYLISGSGLGAAIAGVPLAVLAMILVISFLTGFYLIFRSSVWTLAYLDMQAMKPIPKPATSDDETPEPPPLQTEPQTD